MFDVTKIKDAKTKIRCGTCDISRRHTLRIKKKINNNNLYQWFVPICTLSQAVFKSVHFFFFFLNYYCDCINNIRAHISSSSSGNSSSNSCAQRHVAAPANNTKVCNFKNCKIETIFVYSGPGIQYACMPLLSAFNFGSKSVYLYYLVSQWIPHLLLNLFCFFFVSFLFFFTFLQLLNEQERIRTHKTTDRIERRQIKY